MSQNRTTEQQGQLAPEPWMRATHTELDALRRGVVHALELAREDAERWAATLDEQSLFARPGGVAPIAFHLRHMGRSLDRLLTYAEDRALSEEQLVELRTEMDPGTADEMLAEFRERVADSLQRVRAFTPQQYEQPRGIGRKRLPTTVGGLLVHLAEHTQRHAGQLVTTAKILLAGAGRPDTNPEA